MRKIFAVCLLAFTCAGCIYPTTVVKTVTVERDPAGKILRVIEVESATQVIEESALKLEWIKVEKILSPPPYPESESPRMQGAIAPRTPRT